MSYHEEGHLQVNNINDDVDDDNRCAKNPSNSNNKTAAAKTLLQ